MARLGSPLDSGDAFPPITMARLDGEALSLPRQFDGRWGVVLIYRAHW